MVFLISSPRARQHLAALMVSVLPVLAFPVGVRANHEYGLAAFKVSMLRSFAEFVVWPSYPEELVLCSFGRDELGEELNRVQGHHQQRSVVVRRQVPLDAAGACHILYVPHTEKNQLAAILLAVRLKPVLVIADFPGGAQMGATLSLQVMEQRIGFNVNLSAAREAGLRLSSRLLQLALRVY